MSQATAITADLRGRRALVTGSSRGIGAGIALGLAQAGAAVAVHYVGSADQAEAVAGQVRAVGPRSATFKADLADAGATGQLIDRVTQSLGPVDILVLNASVQLPVTWDQATIEQFDQQMHTNLRSSLQLIQCAVPGMRSEQWGRILTIGSVQEIRPHPDMVVYAASKAGQTSMVRNLAKQLAPDGITVNNLAPGVISTDRNNERLADEAYAARVLGAIPAGRFGDVSDCIGAAVMLCSDLAGYITGQNLFVDGGMGL
jgi:NAD(P)-dependent dehydrogenase (short-subunit alcohol dehydrogenase family)